MSNHKAHTDLEGIDAKIYKRRWLILTSLCVALLGVMLANSCINLAQPLISVDLGINQLELTWIVNIYSLLFACLLFLAGAFGDRYGRKLALQIGSAVFAASAFYAGFLAHSATLSIINNIFPKGQRARAIAVWSSIAGVGMIFGGVIGGVLLEYFTWHAIFYLSAIIAGAGFVVNHIIVCESRDERGLAVDWIGGVLIAVGIFGLIYGVTEAPSQGIFDVTVLICLIGGLVSIVGFVMWERKAKSPLLDLALFKNRAFSVSSLTLVLTFLAMSGVFFTISTLQQLILGMSPLIASLSMIPLMIPMLLMSPLIPNIVKKIGARFTIVIGLFLVAMSLLAISTWTTTITYWNLLIVMFIMMTGISFAMTPGTNILMSSVPRNRAGMGSAMNDTTRELGSTFGVAVFGAILSWVYVIGITDVSSGFTGSVKTALEASLATALNAVQSLGPEAAGLAESVKAAWMSALSTASLVAAGIIFVAVIIAFVALPKHKQQQSDTI
jgi:MFS family permease